MSNPDEESSKQNNNLELTHDEALELFEKNKGLAESFARKYYKTGYWEFDHALQIAYEGLWRACMHFKPSKGFQLSTLAWRIMTNRFIEEQKEIDRQPKILFSVDEFSVEDGFDEGNLPLTLMDVLEDDASSVDQLVEADSLRELKQDIVYILDDIADELKVSKRVIKTAYMCLNEQMLYKNAETKQEINALSKLVGTSLIRKVKTMLQEKLSDLDYN